jgi:hypothetical protein
VRPGGLIFREWAAHHKRIMWPLSLISLTLLAPHPTHGGAVDGASASDMTACDLANYIPEINSCLNFNSAALNRSLGFVIARITKDKGSGGRMRNEVKPASSGTRPRGSSRAFKSIVIMFSTNHGQVATKVSAPRCPVGLRLCSREQTT